MSFQDLATKLDQFDIERSWTDLDPADLAKSIMLEWAELLEHFQWDNTLKNRGKEIPAKNIDAIKSEVADILIYLMKFCREMDIDIADATMKKLKKVGEKYPVDYRWTGDEHWQDLKIKAKYREWK